MADRVAAAMAAVSAARAAFGDFVGPDLGALPTATRDERWAAIERLVDAARWARVNLDELRDFKCGGRWRPASGLRRELWLAYRRALDEALGALVAVELGS